MLLHVLLIFAAAVVLGPPAAAAAARGRGDAAGAARRLRAAHGLELPFGAEPSGDGMLAWLRSNGGSADLRVAVDADGLRGAVAARAFRAGDFVLSMPLKLAIDVGYDNQSSAEHATVRERRGRRAERRERLPPRPPLPQTQNAVAAAPPARARRLPMGIAQGAQPLA